MKQKQIISIVLIITIIMLLILVGITISTLAGENVLLAQEQPIKQAQIESDMQAQLALAIQNLKTEKSENATLDDVTQQWIDSKIQNYECTVKDDALISGKRIIMEKDGVICKFLIDENLSITVIEERESGAQLEYEGISREGENVNILITITDTENGLEQVEFPDGIIVYCNGKEVVAKDYEVQLGVEYIVKITSKNGQVKEEKILINDYYNKITKNLGEGISIDNVAIKAEYNKPYQATITAGNEYKIDTITVTMGGEVVVVDNATGIINIEKVTGDIQIIVTSSRLQLTFYVTYNANGGTGAPGTQIKERDKILTLSSTIPTRSGYNFTGWSTIQNGSVSYQPNQQYTLNENLNLYACWSAIVNNGSYALLTNIGVLTPSSYASDAVGEKAFDTSSTTSIYFLNTRYINVDPSAAGKTYRIKVRERIKKGYTVYFGAIKNDGTQSVIETQYSSATGDSYGYTNFDKTLEFVVGNDVSRYYFTSSSTKYAGWYIYDVSLVY